MLILLRDWLLGQGVDGDGATWVTTAAQVVLVVVLAWVADLVAKGVVVRGLTQLAKRTSTRADDLIVERRVFHRLSHLAPAVVIYLLVPEVLEGFEAWAGAIRQVCLIYMVIVAIAVLDSLLNVVVDIVQDRGAARELPLRSVVQVVQLVLYCVGFIILISLALDRSPVLIFSGLGAMAAVLMLIFKDPILGFVAGIQLAANRMVAPGDWIEMPQFGADGDVLEVGLTTVKVQNFDKTIVTVPTSALITSSFKNWRGMSESDGRRIKRSINLDMGSIRFCDAEMLERYSKIEHMGAYLEDRLEEIARWNATHEVDESSPVNGRRLTNAGTFRAYVVAYLRHHPMVNTQMTLIVRQLAPTEFGLPIEIYVFSREQRWVEYENVQSDIFDHMLAALPEFDLRVYQSPSGGDVEKVARRLEQPDA